ncbi:methionyl-tRNA formyltransferase, mitochondrial isoform X2 [Protopterus annectens]|uniref:methionyl-tRNA formyltransferase, mitochondrial isoform X2 n=1 Tax=Protopterus annectens TaxID=7888 RepID=UPI001CFA4173|nr:methionyl-tRNA formyltransferase, mitochondrial isoform X2 [Protopterus annectens]
MLTLMRNCRHLCKKAPFHFSYFPSVSPGSTNSTCTFQVQSLNYSTCHTIQGCDTWKRTRPPWRVMFFGTDDFAVESLKALNEFSKTTGALVEKLEVVTLPAAMPKELPVRKYAKQHKIVVHEWPSVGTCDQFDVGVVVSFGRLLPEDLILQFPYGILNVHPSLLPRWRGPAPVFHTILHGDKVTGVTVMKVRPKRFDVGPILMQEKLSVPPECTAEILGAMLAELGAKLLLLTLEALPSCIANAREQPKEGATFAPKLTSALRWIRWTEQNCKQIIQLHRALGKRMPLQTLWMGHTLRLLDIVEAHTILGTAENLMQYKTNAGSIHYHKDSNTLLVHCQDGLVGVKALIMKKKLSAADFYNGYLHQYVSFKSSDNAAWQFQTPKLEVKEKTSVQKKEIGV